MFRHALLTVGCVAAACSAQDAGRSAPRASDQPGTTAITRSANGLPRNSPLEPGITNVPATSGRANMAAGTAPFTTTELGRFDHPFALTILPDGAALITEKTGHLRLRAADGTVTEIAGVPPVAFGGQNGLFDIALAPGFTENRMVFLTFSQGSSSDDCELVLARARFDGKALRGLTPIWRSGQRGPGGQMGANILFAPDGKSIFLSSGERQRFTPAQDPDQALGKILRLTLDGKAFPGNPGYARGGVQAMTWSTGHRNPYGLAFDGAGRLWEEEMGPRGGDELNLIEPGRNYGWPIVSNGDNYSGQPISDHPSRPEFAAPKLWWNPSISPGGMIVYTGALFPAWRGSALIAALSDESLIRVALDGDRARPADVWKMGTRIRDVAQAVDGSVWLIEDGERGAGGKLLRLTPR